MPFPKGSALQPYGWGEGIKKNPFRQPEIRNDQERGPARKVGQATSYRVKKGNLSVRRTEPSKGVQRILGRVTRR